MHILSCNYVSYNVDDKGELQTTLMITSVKEINLQIEKSIFKTTFTLKHTHITHTQKTIWIMLILIINPQITDRQKEIKCNLTSLI